MKKKNSEQPPVQGGFGRRQFLKWSAALGGVTAVSGTGVLYGLRSVESAEPFADKVVWTSCNVNCGSRCALRASVKDGVVTRVETDDTGTDVYGDHQVRACLRGRSMRHRIYAPDRLKYPMKRVGKRGEGKFERISWDEALDGIAQRLGDTIKKHGNESVYLNYGTGNLGAVISKSWPTGSTPVARLMNCLGGYLNQYGTYSDAQIDMALPYTFGKGWVKGNLLSDIVNSKLVVFFGNNPAATRMSGGGLVHDVIEARKKGYARIIVIDPRFTDTATTLADEWIPIHPGTDAALVCGLAYVMITENLVDNDFIKRCTVGYDEASMPDGVPAGNSYKSYILGKGRDGQAKTPEWASKITGIPVRRIVQLAREIGQAEPCYISQGWSVQRQANGENNCRAISMLPILTGNVGVQGGNTGARESGYGIPFAAFPVLENPVKTSISCFTWTDAIERGTEMTAKRDGVRGRDRLQAPIKFIWNYAGNCLVNQHSDSNRTSEILADDSKCETVVVVDNFMTPSARFADYLLPATSNLEEDDFAPQGFASEMGYVVFAEKVIEPLFESRTIYDICAGVAKRLGAGETYTEGRTRAQWVDFVYQQSRQQLPELPPTLKEAFKLGVFKRKNPGLPAVPYKEFRDDPEGHPLKSPSGKLEIFSKQLWDIAHEWELADGDVISGLPEYAPTWEGVADPLKKDFPLQLIGHHYKQRTHSTYGNVDWLKKVAPQELWINPLDAGERGVEHGAKVKVFNDRGVVYTIAKVTPRIMPGVLSLPEGAWFAPGSDGADQGGCVNVLTTLRPSPLAKGNPQHTNLVQVEKA
ncbi:molybdopterin-dependent oxidoreductase [Pseudodesulfovibrio sp. JC047]|uniref:DMSO/selenate family reductase complex A subunit n=1 Tax=Pseudodesulfovibrio sp. JC047 TaxID=2683199 RepID=UPI0013D4F257|nr:DMSO/selenate family reductase complex A subunit [Pseudodesulfovibrio sp. JC047]NDV18656.1 molybdopterin-dependent oxidoreductase [Pseudodesulfovibrio sp. JC047]